MLTILTIVAIIVAGGLIVGVGALDRYLDPFDDRPFNQAEWSSANERERGPMARDAVRHLLPGMSADQVRELLGPTQPVYRDPRGPVDGYGNRLEHPETWAYWLGCWSGLGPYSFDDAFLYVHFGADGRVIAAEITGG